MRLKAVHVSWAVLLCSIGSIITSIGMSLTTGHLDWNALLVAIMAVIGSFTPAAQLGLPMFESPKTKTDMPKLVN